jgi:transposase InsO family protein
MRHTDVVLCLSGVLKDFKAKEIMLRTDNGSQFIANDLRSFCQSHTPLRKHFSKWQHLRKTLKRKAFSH